MGWYYYIEIVVIQNPITTGSNQYRYEKATSSVTLLCMF